MDRLERLNRHGPLFGHSVQPRPGQPSHDLVDASTTQAGAQAVADELQDQLGDEASVLIQELPEDVGEAHHNVGVFVHLAEE